MIKKVPLNLQLSKLHIFQGAWENCVYLFNLLEQMVVTKICRLPKQV